MKADESRMITRQAIIDLTEKHYPRALAEAEKAIADARKCGSYTAAPSLPVTWLENEVALAIRLRVINELESRGYQAGLLAASSGSISVDWGPAKRSTREGLSPWLYVIAFMILTAVGFTIGAATSAAIYRSQSQNQGSP